MVVFTMPMPWDRIEFAMCLILMVFKCFLSPDSASFSTNVCRWRL